MKVLIWDKGIKLASVGGPVGYMYNIHEYIKNHPSESVYFYSDVAKFNNNGVPLTFQQGGSLKKAVRTLLKPIIHTNLLSFIRDIKSYYHSSFKLDDNDRNLLEQYDFVHVHHLPTLMSLFLKNEVPARIIFTTHFPEPLIDETANNRGCGWVLRLFPFIRTYYLKKEANAISSSFKVMLPVREAIEAYTENNRIYKNLFEEIESKLFFVPTSIYPSEKSIPEGQSSLESKELDPSYLKVCFVGRHNQIKGYDQLQMIAKQIWKSSPKTYFIIGGKEEPLKGLNDKRWIELGWVNTFALLEEIDVFVLPNKQTFFDLIMIEVLRQGVPCVISNTGGNKWFEKFNLDGIRVYNYNDFDTASRYLEEFSEIKKHSGLQDIRERNKKFFMDHFTVSEYLNDYILQLSSFIF